jgi:hypothetical protein
MELTRPAAGNAVAVTMAEAVVFKNWRRFKGEQSHPHKKEGCFMSGDYQIEGPLGNREKPKFSGNKAALTAYHIDERAAFLTTAFLHSEERGLTARNIPHSRSEVKIVPPASKHPPAASN